MFLTYITESNNDAGSKYLAYQGLPHKYLNQKFKQQVIDNKVQGKTKKIPEQLYPSF